MKMKKGKKAPVGKEKLTSEHVEPFLRKMSQDMFNAQAKKQKKNGVDWQKGR